MSKKAGSLKVGKLHDIHCEQHGNLDGETIVFVHGGPGVGTSHKDLTFFDLDKVNVILFDQRGCGRSTPKGELRNNTTQDLIEDINHILRYFNKKDVYLFGGSWGATISLLFGIRYPEKVKGMILRGLFTGAKKERQYLQWGREESGFLAEWKRFLSFVPRQHRNDPSDYFFRQILEGDKASQLKYSFELDYYSSSLSSERGKSNDIDQKIRNNDFLTKARIAAHYSINDFFIPEQYIENNMNTLSHIPIKIIHGLDDQITLYANAKRFCKRYENVELVGVRGGHSPFDEKIKEGLITAVGGFVN